MLPGMEIDVAVRAHELPVAWSEGVEAEAAALPAEVRSADVEGREDLRGLGFVTIDGEDARDFDDAVYCERTPGGWRVVVAIADVSAYVRPGTALDGEARLRGNSVYFPDRVIPMLPEIDLERAVLAAPARGPALSRLRADRHRFGPRAPLAVLRRRDSLAGAPDLHRGRGRARRRRHTAARSAGGGGADARCATRGVRGAARRPRRPRSDRSRPDRDPRGARRRRPGGAARAPGAQRRAPDHRGVHGRGQRRRRALPRTPPAAGAVSRPRGTVAGQGGGPAGIPRRVRTEARRRGSARAPPLRRGHRARRVAARRPPGSDRDAALALAGGVRTRSTSGTSVSRIAPTCTSPLRSGGIPTSSRIARSVTRCVAAGRATSSRPPARRSRRWATTAR